MSIEGDTSNRRAPVLNPDLSGRSAMCIAMPNPCKFKAPAGRHVYQNTPPPQVGHLARLKAPAGRHVPFV